MSKSANYSVSDGAERLADKLARMAQLGPSALQKTVVETTMLAKEAIVDKITSEIEPHSGLSRDNNPQAIVSDLVDTGTFRESWQVSFPSAYVGKLATNVEYALPLEYGTDHMPGFYVARDTAKKMRPIFVERIKKAMKVLGQ